ncbi:hypothetical protein PENARI_c002G08696 [Penicillium arizonense]|uniref:H/ACA ribonucleoprotein complex subunit NOP10 n=1 Tax=Penicillium arizonense TaxID=1835702 RepID=A0A1F5LV15_PENAI|nr:hypothetical protein PENARI_c002G08696 [Penicillium arizonense]OGE56751.1 hypothetical protein PENARI_c002G08696 [Penicillium arizonense]
MLDSFEEEEFLREARPFKAEHDSAGWPELAQVHREKNSSTIAVKPKRSTNTAKMHLMYTLDTEGKRVYTLKKVLNGEVTKSAHPARFSPDDKYSRHRVTLKKRYGLLLTQQSAANPAQA